jgi:release factor glutamine methyltransferase
VEVYAADIDPVAVRCARRNVPGAVFEGDLYGALPRSLMGRVDILIANAPYVPTGEVGMMPPEARVYEPPVALDGGADGLDILRRVIAGAPQWLAAGGYLLVESSERQAPQLVDAAVRHGLRARITTAEDLGATAVVAELVR